MSNVFIKPVEDALQGDFDWVTDTIGILLISTTNSYVFDADDETVNDVLSDAAEFTDASYSRQTLDNTTVNRNEAEDRAEAQADNVVFEDLDGDEIDSAITFVENGDDDNRFVIAHHTSDDFPLQANGGDVTIEWDASGVKRIDAG